MLVGVLPDKQKRVCPPRPFKILVQKIELQTAIGIVDPVRGISEFELANFSLLQLNKGFECRQLLLVDEVKLNCPLMKWT